MQQFSSSVLTVTAQEVSGWNDMALHLCLRRCRCIQLHQSHSLNHSLSTFLCLYLHCFEFYHTYHFERERQEQNLPPKRSSELHDLFCTLLQRGCFKRGWLFSSVVVTWSSIVKKSIPFFFKHTNTISLCLMCWWWYYLQQHHNIHQVFYRPIRPEDNVYYKLHLKAISQNINFRRNQYISLLWR